MGNLRVYNYHPLSGVFLFEGEADKDQLDADNWLIPANATDKKPPKQKSGYALAFKNDKWENVIDNRGLIYWLEDGGEHVITVIGEELPKGALTEKPVAEPVKLTSDQIEQLLATEYADPITGSDRYFLEAARKRTIGDEQGALKAEQQGLELVAEIKNKYN